MSGGGGLGTTFGWWLRKEFREHCVHLLLLGLVVPLGSWMIVHREARSGDTGVHESHGGAPDPILTSAGKIEPHHRLRDEWEVLLLASAALTVAVVASGLFAGDIRRGTAALLARTPGALRAAFVAKLAFLAAVLVGMLIVHAVVLARLGTAYRLAQDGDAGRTFFDGWAVWPTGANQTAYGVVAAIGTWVLLASAVVPWIGVPALVGGLVGLGVSIPGVLWAHEHPYFFCWWVGGPAGPVAALASTALGLTALVWFRWTRVSRSASWIGLRVAGIALLCAAAANGAMWGAVSRYRDFDAYVPDLRLQDGVVGVGDRFVYLHAYRGDCNADPNTWDLPYGTLPVPWRVDLTTGSWASCGAPDVTWFGPSWRADYGSGQMPPVLLVVHDGRWDSDGGTWFDARTGENLGHGEGYWPPIDVTTRNREAFREATGVRDSQGRRVWILDGHIEREDGTSIPVRIEPQDIFEIPGGWAGHGRDAGEGTLWTLDADTGRERRYPPPEHVVRPAELLGWWDPRHALVRAVLKDAFPGHGGYGSLASAFYGVVLSATPLAQWDRLDLDNGSVEPFASDLEPALGAAVPLARTGLDTLLLLRREPGDATIGRWTVGSRAIERTPWQGVPLAGIEAAEVHGVGAHLGEPLLLKVWRSEPPGHVDEVKSDRRRELPPLATLETAWALYDPDGNNLTALRSWRSEWHEFDPLRVLPDRSLLALESNRRIVRLGPEAGRREVLFPRR